MMFSFQKETGMPPRKRASFTIALASLAGMVLCLTLSACLGPLCATTGPPSAEFVAVGQAYLPQLGKAYATAWEKGALSLESGHDIGTALDAVAVEWMSARGTLFESILAPRFAAIITEGTAAGDVTAVQRAAMAAAFRGVAKGLTLPKLP
jgi:hypothetical protein